MLFYVGVGLLRFLGSLGFDVNLILVFNKFVNIIISPCCQDIFYLLKAFSGNFGF